MKKAQGKTLEVRIGEAVSDTLALLMQEKELGPRFSTTDVFGAVWNVLDNPPFDNDKGVRVKDFDIEARVISKLGPRQIRPLNAEEKKEELAVAKLARRILAKTFKTRG